LIFETLADAPQENFGSVLRDCSKVLTTNAQAEKAYYRSASALTYLGRYEEAIDCCDRCLLFSPDNAGVKTLREKAVKGEEARKAKIAEAEERTRQDKLKKFQLSAALKVGYLSIHSCHMINLIFPFRNATSSLSLDHQMVHPTRPILTSQMAL
jgi:tetratricopeptide (TPR) repeat protein